MSETSGAAPAWEQSKENAAPLERGRNVTTLGLRPSSLSQQDLKKKIDEYEDLVRPSEAPHVTEMNDDPIVHWLGYIKFMQTSYPADTRDNFLLMERCVRALVKMKQYSNDDRFVGVCAKYADKTKDPGQVFKYLHQQRVGTHTALFWIAWAFVAEKDNDFPFAEQVFKKGISKNAEPLQMLKLRHRQFQRRMSRYWLNSSRANDHIDEYEDDNQCRSTLGGISRERVRRNDRSINNGRSSDRSRNIATNQQQVPASHGSFSIFVEPEKENGYNLDQSFAENDSRVIAREADRKKENNLDAERWNERGGLHSSFQRATKYRSAGPPPAFSVFVDEECAIQNERQDDEQRKDLDRHRQARDERTFRERDVEGMAEKLARDPLRYVRDPSQLDIEIKSTSKIAPPHSVHRDVGNLDTFSKTERKSKTGFNKRLLKNKYREEQCFEEARAYAGSYILVAGSSSNFNLLHATSKTDHSSQMDIEDEDRSMDISMAESFSRSVPNSTSSKQPFKLQRTGSKAESKRLFQPDASFEVGLNQTAISTASSVINEFDGVGISRKKEEETINTKLAMKELSMMFSSPAFGIDSARRQNDYSIARSRINESIDDGEQDRSFGILGDGIMLDNSICNTGSEENFGERNPSTRSNSTEGFENMALRELEADSTEEGIEPRLGCGPHGNRALRSIVQSNHITKAEREMELNPGFTIFEDNAASNGEVEIHQPASELQFQIYEDADDEIDDSDRKPAAKLHDGDTAFGENSDCSVDNPEQVHDSHIDHGDTASITDAIALLGDSGDQEESGHKSEIVEGEETATLTLFNEVFRCDESVTPNEVSTGGGFSIFVDVQNESNDQADDVKNLNVVGDQDRKQDNATNPPVVDYNVAHEHDIRTALKRLKTYSIVATDSRVALYPLLMSKGVFYHLPSISLPKQLRSRKCVPRDTEISVGKHEGILKKELGRGAYGTVLLMDGPSSRIAIKAQSPTDSLAWEYEIMQRLENRLSSNCPTDASHFPSPLSFLNLSDGGLLSMSAASESGLHLVDLSNFYKFKLGETVPELLALHYTSVALRIVEKLHWHGKILHCDVKPDNFVLSSSNSFQNNFRDIEFSDLTLVDWGRAIDLVQYSFDPEDGGRNVAFIGTAAQKEMQCVSMRSQGKWSFDADTFGILCSAHVLLFGEHMDIKKGKGNKWKTKSTFKRYWQQDLWHEIFDALLNPRDMDRAFGSRSSSLRSLWRKIDSFLKEDPRQEKLRCLLARQAKLLPDSREKI